MAPFVPDKRGATDIAALSGSVVAVSVSLFVGDGPFGSLNAAVSVTLILVILGYAWRTTRRLTQSLAISAAVGLATVPAYGFVYEHIQNKAYSYQYTEKFVCLGDIYDTKENKKSRVCQDVLTIDWLTMWMIAFVIDMVCQMCWRKPYNIGYSDYLHNPNWNQALRQPDRDPPA